MKTEDATYNKQLKHILSNLKNLVFDDPRVPELQNALKSKFNETKKHIIGKYNNEES